MSTFVCEHAQILLEWIWKFYCRVSWPLLVQKYLTLSIQKVYKILPLWNHGCWNIQVLITSCASQSSPKKMISRFLKYMVGVCIISQSIFSMLHNIRAPMRFTSSISYRQSYTYSLVKNSKVIDFSWKHVWKSQRQP